ncbi:hypothetical protein [Natronomonas sp. EA1]|uniref:hypothetical protein n=1 Tax=Natronomonas sp. EA1 TaxID=3421655 RepID=UPI003EBFF35E
MSEVIDVEAKAESVLDYLRRRVGDDLRVIAYYDLETERFDSAFVRDDIRLEYGPEGLREFAREVVDLAGAPRQTPDDFPLGDNLADIGWYEDGVAVLVSPWENRGIIFSMEPDAAALAELGEIISSVDARLS